MKEYQYVFGIEMITELGIALVSTVLSSEKKVKRVPLMEITQEAAKDKTNYFKIHMGCTAERVEKTITKGVILNSFFQRITEEPLKAEVWLTTKENVKVYAHGVAFKKNS